MPKETFSDDGRWTGTMPTRPSRDQVMTEALSTTLANLEDHQGCIIPPHLNDEMRRTIQLALASK
jgi:hypothetical protein